MPGTKTVANVALYTIGEIVPKVLSFLLLPILTHYLSTGDYGISSYTNTVTTFLYVLTTLSVNTYALRYYYKINTSEEKKKLLGNIFLFLSGWGLIMLVLESLLLPFLLKTFSVQVPFYPYFLLALIINFFDITSVIPLVAYRVNDDAKGFVMLSLGRTILQYILILCFVAYYKMGLLGSYTGRLAASIPFFFVYSMVMRKKGSFNFNFKQIKEGLHFSLPLLPGALSYLVISMFDRIILERYVSLSALGLYSVASTLALTLNVVIQGLYRTFEQKIFREHSKEGYKPLVDSLYKIYIVALFIPGFMLILYVKEILLFFTSQQYYPSAQYVVYLVVAVIVSGMNTFFGTILIADNKRKIITYSSFISAIASFALNLVLIKIFGVFGACIASILSFLVVYIFYFRKVDLVNKYLFQQVLFVTIFFGSAFFIPNNLSIPADIGLKFLCLIAFFIVIKFTMKISLPSFYIAENLQLQKKRKTTEEQV